MPSETPAISKVTPTLEKNNSVPPLVLTAAEAALRFRKSLRTWRTWDATGKIPRPIRIGRSTYWRPEELEAWVAAGCPDREAWEQDVRRAMEAGGRKR